VAKRLDSPCIDVCQLNPRTGFCIGCGRTIDEITQWACLSPQQRQHILAALPARVSAVAPAAP
jgi:predicted Fe-S protein YdhL (DUF1289 family)